MARRGLTKPAEIESAISGVESARPSDWEIAERAYVIYDREGRVEGRDLDNWLRAESELMNERQIGGQLRGGNGDGANEDRARGEQREPQKAEQNGGKRKNR